MNRGKMNRGKMRWAAALVLPAALIGVGLGLGPGSARPAGGDQQLADNFDQGLCLSSASCPWFFHQRVDGEVSAAPAPGRRGRAFHALAGPKQGDRVAKAALVARVAPAAAGSLIRVSFDMMVPPGRPGNSLQLVDLECADCGWSHNPGVRLYLRHGRLRIDRSKIDVAQAWVNDGAPQLQPGRWHNIVYELRVSAGDDGGARASLDGQEVVAGQGRTLMTSAMDAIDRVQIGLTANSNREPAELWIDNVKIAVTAPAKRAH